MVAMKLFLVDGPHRGEPTYGDLQSLLEREYVDQVVAFQVRLLRPEFLSVDLHMRHEWVQERLVGRGLCWIDHDVHIIVFGVA